jgi:SAM-dependent methyltransferase
MHPSSFEKVAAFRREYLDARKHERLTILDLGSQDINGSYRPLFQEPEWRYIGVDMAAGTNVHIVLKNPYHWREIPPGSVDVIISGQTFEHTEFFWETAAQIARALKPDGLCCILAPSAGPEHRYPLDCWRFYPDGLRAVARYAGLEVLAATTQWTDLPHFDNESNKWHDSMLVARKRHESLRTRATRALHSWIARRLPYRTISVNGPSSA